MKRGIDIRLSIPSLLSMTSQPYYRYAWVESGPVIISEIWRRSEIIIHRLDGPAWREWEVVDGQTEPILKYESWWLNGRLHRLDGPASRTWRVVAGLPVLMIEVWQLEGKLHRLDGPAHRMWEGNGDQPFYETWALENNTVEPFALPFVRELTVQHLRECGLVIWPGLMDLITSYLV